jgi:hypothetical protein
MWVVKLGFQAVSGLPVVPYGPFLAAPLNSFVSYYMLVS